MLKNVYPNAGQPIKLSENSITDFNCTTIIFRTGGMRCVPRFDECGPKAVGDSSRRKHMHANERTNSRDSVPSGRVNGADGPFCPCRDPFLLPQVPSAIRIPYPDPKTFIPVPVTVMVAKKQYSNRTDKRRVHTRMFLSITGTTRYAIAKGLGQLAVRYV